MNPLVPLAALVASLWVIVFAARGRLVDGCLLYLLTACCFGHPFVNFDLGPFPLTLDRLVLGLVLAMYIIRRRFGILPAQPWTRSDRLVAAFMAWLVGSMIYGLWLGGETPPIVAFFQLFGGYLMPVAAYWVARHAPADERQLRFAHGALALFGVYLGMIGVLEILHAWPLVFPRYIADPKLGLHFGRARGPMLHSVSYGLYLSTAIGAAWMWQWRVGRFGKLALWGVMGAHLAGIALCYTRSVWIGMGLALVVVFALSLKGTMRLLVLSSMGTAALLIALTQMDNLVGFKREFSEAETRDSAQVRAVFAYVSWNMFLDRPLLGVGFGQFRTAKIPYLADRESELRLEAIRDWVHHNNYLSVLTETGLVGFALFLAMLASWAAMAWRGWYDETLPPMARAQALWMLAVLGVYAAQLAFHELSFSPLDNSLMFFLAGLTGAAINPQPAVNRKSAPAVALFAPLAPRPSLG